MLHTYVDVIYIKAYVRLLYNVMCYVANKEDILVWLLRRLSILRKFFCILKDFNGYSIFFFFSQQMVRRSKLRV